MIIDVHGHYTTSPPELMAYRGNQVNTLARPSKGSIRISDDQIRESLENGQLKLQRECRIDAVLFSPRAAGMGHHFGDERISLYWSQVNNELIARICELYPGQFIGVCQLPQSPGVNPANCSAELERCINEFGFVGCNLNPDPSGGTAVTPSLGDPWWHPIYEKLVELDVPAMIHVSSSINPGLQTTAAYYLIGDTAATYQLLESNVFDNFPTLKLVIPHGAGALPAQVARWRAIRMIGGGKSLEEGLKQLYFDTTVYSQDAMEMLIKAVGIDNIMFATEMIGAVHIIDPDTGRWFDDTKPLIDAIKWLTEEDRQKIFEGNARKVYSRLNQRLAVTA